MNHGKPEAGVGYGEFKVCKEFAFKMGWAKPDPNYTVTLGPNAIPMLCEYKENVNRKEAMVYGVSDDAFINGAFLVAFDHMDDMVLFSNRLRWRFVNLNEAFGQSFGQVSCTLYLYADVGESVMVGGSKMDLLREVPYDLRQKVLLQT